MGGFLLKYTVFLKNLRLIELLTFALGARSWEEKDME
jgi:hypothetical protein